ncbi:LysR family transcriptional regulator [Pseudomonas sp. S2_C03]
MNHELDSKIRSFLCISMHGSISKASEHLEISQPSLSRQLASLEAFVGRPLFKRTGRGLILTDAGTHLAASAGPAFIAIDSALTQIREQFGVTQGNLRLATVHTLTYYFLGAVVARFVHENEDVNVSFMARSSTEVVKLVESGRAELGFVYDSAVASAELVSQSLFMESMCIVIRAEEVAPQGTLDLHEACPRLVVFPQGYALRRMLDTSGITYTIAAEVETVDAMLELVSSGVGACILPSFIPSRVLEQYQLKRVPDITPALTRKVVAIFKSDQEPSAVTREFLRRAAQTIPFVD